MRLTVSMDIEVIIINIGAFKKSENIINQAQDFLNNPQLMTGQFIEIVHSVQNNMEIDGICYMKLDGEEYYLQEIYEHELS